MNAERVSRAHLVVLGCGALLALTSMAFAWRATQPTNAGAEASLGRGVFTPAGAERARAVLGVLARGLLACQEEDGSFRTQAETDGVGYNDLGERASATALCAVALTSLRPHVLAGAVRRPGAAALDLALAKSMGYLRGAQLPDGTFARTDKRDPWLAVQATSASVLALALLDDPADAAVLGKGIDALQGLAADKIGAGWGRVLVAITADRLRERELDAQIEGGAEALVDVRISTTVPTTPEYLTWDTTLSEVLSRVVRSTRTGAFDPLPAQALEAALAEPPDWRGDATDPRTWWAQAWIVGRSAHPGSRGWFEGLVAALETWADTETGLLPSSYYGTELDVTVAAFLALEEGLRGLPPAEG